MRSLFKILLLVFLTILTVSIDLFLYLWHKIVGYKLLPGS